MIHTFARITLAFSALFMLCLSASAQNYDLSWHTIDGGGATWSTGGAFTLGGTAGQPDPSLTPLTGGPFSLVGGFWPAAGACTCAGDTNGDGLRDAADIQSFVTCLVNGQGCECADIDGVNGVTAADAAAFVAQLLGGTPCS